MPGYNPGIFLAILGWGPMSFLIGKISGVNPVFGKISKHSKLMIFSQFTHYMNLISLKSFNNH